VGWQDIAREQAAVIGHHQLRAQEMTDSAVRHLVTRGVLNRLCLGVYSVAGAPFGFMSRTWAATLATDGTIGFSTAAYLWGLIAVRPPVIDVIVDVERRSRRPMPGTRLHRVQLRDRDRTRLSGGAPVTNRACTALDFVGRLGPEPALTFIDRALQQGWLSRNDIARRVREQPGRTGNVRLRQLLDVTGDGAAAESERILHNLLRSGGLAGWEANLVVPLSNGGHYEVDVGWSKLRLAIEIDGLAHHISVERFQSDRTRQNRLVNDGWTILRFTWADLINRPDYVIATVRRAIARAGEDSVR
jgi:very-short-patch-repair endonuclease